MIDKRDYFAIQILHKLMDRCIEPGYTDRDAINEAYNLADLMIDRRTYTNQLVNEFELNE